MQTEMGREWGNDGGPVVVFAICSLLAKSMNLLLAHLGIENVNRRDIHP